MEGLAKFTSLRSLGVALMIVDQVAGVEFKFNTSLGQLVKSSLKRF